MAAPLTLLLTLLPVLGEDSLEWGSFRGNNGTGLADGPIPAVLDLDKNLSWRTAIPAGYSSPTVAGKRVFVTAAEGEELLTLCLDRHSGEVLWQRDLPFHGERTGANSPAAPTPVTDGEFVYCLFHDFGLIVYDVEGEEIWTRPMGPFAIPHGMSSTPLAYGDLLILQVDQDSGSYLVALENIDGEERWKVERPGFTHSYATPALYVPEDGPAQVIVSGSFKISGYSALDGELLWWVEGSSFMTKGVPVVIGDRCIINAYAASSTEAGLPKVAQSFEAALAEKDRDEDGKISQAEFDHPAMRMSWFVFDLDDDGFLDERDWQYLASSGRPTGGLFAIALDGRGDVTDSHVQWKYDGRRGLPDVTSPLVYGDTVFLVKSGSLLTAFDAETGEVGKQGRIGDSDRFFASPVAAGGKIVTASLSGQLAVISAERDWEVLSRTDLGEETWSTPALAPGQVLVRTQKALYCFGVEAGAGQ